MKRAFSKSGTTVIALATAVAAFLSLEWASAIPFIAQMLTNPNVPVPSAVMLSARVLLFTVVDTPLLATGYYAVLSILIGINVALLVFYFRLHRAAPSLVSMTGSLGGFIFAALGFGCAACGSVFVTSLFATVGGAGLLALMPLHGLEVGILGMLLLVFSAWHLTKNINRPAVCPI